MSDPTTPGARTAPAIVCRGVTKQYGALRALDGVDVEVAAGEFAVLVGPSGSGKTTLIGLIAALDTPDAGQIEVNGHTLARRSRHLDRYRRLEVGIVFQLHNLIPGLTARQNVEIAMLGTHHSRKERAARATELLHRLSLDDRADERPPTLSGGERQRVAVARALANEPAVLLADEPTGSLDDVTAEVVVGLFEELVSTGVTVLAVSHDARLTDRAHRRITVVDGRIGQPVAAGSLDTSITG